MSSLAIPQGVEEGSDLGLLGSPGRALITKLIPTLFLVPILDFSKLFDLLVVGIQVDELRQISAELSASLSNSS
jgi:hypothetical protein